MDNLSASASLTAIFAFIFVPSLLSDAQVQNCLQEQSKKRHVSEHKLLLERLRFQMTRVAVALLVIASTLCFALALDFGHQNVEVLAEIDALAAEPISPLWFTQPVDHFAATTKFPDWQQMYYVNDTYWSGNGAPILFLMGGEAPVTPSSVQGRFVINELAAKLHALIISAEHRFYGQSLPFSDLSTTGLVYATSRQALADFASLAKYTKQARNAANSKIVAMGGSYSGNLAAWARYVYPEVFDAAWASSAPVEAKLEFPEYFQVLSKALGPVCWLYVADSAIVTHSGVLSGGNLQAKVEQMYQTCAQLNVSKAAFDLQVFFYSILGSVADIVQYSDDNNNYQPFNINTMCRMLAATTSPTNLANVVRNVTEYNKANCTESTYASKIKSVNDIRPQASNSYASLRVWTWQTCNEFGYYQTVDTNHVHLLSLAYYQKICNEAFGIDSSVTATRILQTNEYYKGKTLIDATSKTIFSNGYIDPWHALGIIEGGNTENLVTFIKGTAHCADLYPSRAADAPSLTVARRAIVAQLTQWIGS